MTFEIDISNRQQMIPIDPDAIRAAILRGLQIERVASAVLSISIVDNPTIHELNRVHLQHDVPTDVISFQLEFCRHAHASEESVDEDETGSADIVDEGQHPASGYEDGRDLRAAGAAIEGEIIASAEMAASMAAQGGWSAQDELTLYLVHGFLHICGYDDLSDSDQSVMRSRERAILGSLGLNIMYAEDSGPDCE